MGAGPAYNRPTSLNVLRVGIVELKQANKAVPESPPAEVAPFLFFDLKTKFSINLYVPESLKPLTFALVLTDVIITSSFLGSP